MTLIHLVQWKVTPSCPSFCCPSIQPSHIIFTINSVPHSGGRTVKRMRLPSERTQLQWGSAGMNDPEARPGHEGRFTGKEHNECRRNQRSGGASLIEGWQRHRTANRTSGDNLLGMARLAFRWCITHHQTKLGARLSGRLLRCALHIGLQ